MPVQKTKGGFTATYDGVTKTFKTRAAAEKWATKYKRPNVGTPRRGAGPRRTGRTSRAY